ncbi:MAG: GrpB family protein [Acidimicrobiia bacterium]|jgi:GrpB-like predicted nucleotidyltransferase (UPF0157 family)
MAGVTIELHDYDPEWPRLYEQEASRIAAALGGRVKRLEHVGSTSVPGLAAKPIVDIVLAVDDASDEQSYAIALADLGYRLHIREPEWFEHRLFRGPHNKVNLHIFSDGAAEIERMTRFRDRLRSSSADRRRYGDEKRELAGLDWVTVQAYADAKSEIVEQILSNAHRGRQGS